MSRDESDRGDRNGSSGWALILVIAVVAAGFSLLANPGKSSPATPAPLPSRSFSPFPTASASSPAPAPAVSLDPIQSVLQQAAGFVAAKDICPARTNGRTTLDVSTVLFNPTRVTETLLQLSPALPGGGLTSRTLTIRSGDCQHPTGTPEPLRRHVLTPGATVLVTLHLGLPKVCPQPYPVELDVTLTIAGNVRSEQLRLYNDLGAISFASCPKPTAS